MYKYHIILVFLFSSQFILSQENFTAIYPDSLKENANAIIRENRIEIEISSFNKMTIKNKRIITIFNELGLRHIDAYEYFDKTTSIKKIEATVYNTDGAEIKKIKRKDFKEHAITENSIISDGRVLYLEFTPTRYPITLVYESETTTSNTAFIPTWYAIDDYNLGIVKSSITIKYVPEVKFKYKEENFNPKIEKQIFDNSIQFTIQHVKPLKQEELSPSITKIIPYVLFGLDKFSLEGVTGNAESWNSFGAWMYEYLLKDSEEIPIETIQKLKVIIGAEKDHLKIAKIIYQFMQDKTRYISIQLGIGGWKPMNAKDVDRLGYGDCKALTNYTRSLLKAFDVPSYYTIVYGDEVKRDLEEDFVSMQGNHVILGIPNGENITWLECTSQVQPFGFQGDFTDDRKVLIIDDKKSEIVKTSSYNEAANNQKTTAILELFDNGDLNCEAIIVSKGIIYDNKFQIEIKSKDELIKYYQENLSNINNKEFSAINITHKKEQLELEEKIIFTAKEFVKKNDKRIILPINILNPITFIPPKYKDRKNPFQISRGYLYEDEVTLKIPQNSSVESIPTGLTINSIFGEYTSTIHRNDNNTILFKRRILMRKGYYSADKYEDYRKFREQISKNDNLKIVLITN